jgi:hypothetical protein
VDAVERIEQRKIGEAAGNLKIPYKVDSYKLRQKYGGESLSPEGVVHWRINCLDQSGFGTGVLQVLLHSLIFQSDKRPAFASMKAKIERIMPRIFEKYAGPDVLALLERADENTIRSFEKAIKSRGEEGAWLFYNGKGDIRPVTLDPRARFEYYVDHIINQFYLGCETPLPRLFSTPGFTEASAKSALELQNMLVHPVQRHIKRQVERELFAAVLVQSGFDPVKAQVRLHWGSPQTKEVSAADLLKATERGFISEDMEVAYGRYEEAYKAIHGALSGLMAPPAGKRVTKLAFTWNTDGTVSAIAVYDGEETLFTLTFTCNADGSLQQVTRE